jgi:hypothetical protein
MASIPEHFHLSFHPIALPEATIRLGNMRFTVLTERLIRLEYHPEACFEDLASQAIWYREQAVPAFELMIGEGSLKLETAYLRLSYQANEDAGFSPANLSIELKESGIVWHPNDDESDNLLGSTRTLDFVNGYTPLSKGLISRAGWSVLDDSKSLVFNEEFWLEPRIEGGTDWYFFGYGHEYKACLKDYCKISGQIPLVPRWILGNWWSRYWAYSQDELMALMEEFEAQEIPLSVCIVDMDWHITQTGNSSSGWTGYTWNRELFPEPEAFLRFVHEKGLHTGFNLHPADGVHPHEEAYPAMARRLGIDPETKTPIPFDISSTDFMTAYFEFLHHPYEKMGVDFWWVDWQQGQTSKIKGLDPLWLINHLHFYDSGREGKRPFIFSRWGNEGHQRYPIGFSGDSYITWDSLRFQPYMTATSSNVAYGMWSHDIGGHVSGNGDPELLTRWLQFGVFSPIMRIHSGKGYYYERRPWMLDDVEALNALRGAMQLRHAFLPYLYTMARRAHDESIPLMLPMYYDYPEEESAYYAPHQYLFGSELIAAPFVEAKDEATQLSRQVVWLPEGDWYHFFSGEVFTGGWHSIYGKLEEIPLFAKAGAIVPLCKWNNPEELIVNIFAGANNSFTLYEDDGETMAYANGEYRLTRMSQDFSGNRLSFRMEKSVERSLSLAIHGVSSDVKIMLSADYQARYDAETETLHLTGIQASELELVLESPNLLSRRNRKKENLLKMVKSFRLHNGVRNNIAAELEQILENPEGLAPYLITMKESQARALCESLFEAGVHQIKDTQYPRLLILWNNKADSEIRYRYSDIYLFFGHVTGHKAERGKLPTFKAIVPPIKSWKHGTLEEGVQYTQFLAEVDYHNVYRVSEGHLEETP